MKRSRITFPVVYDVSLNFVFDIDLKKKTGLLIF